MNTRIIISGGGTGGHIFPAISIANALKQRLPQVDILFVGAEGKMEMEKVPAAGYRIVGLPVAGFQRKLSWQSVTFFFKLWKSMRLAKKVVRDFAPQVAIGVGGFASGPVLKVASRMGIPTVLQEQNSYAGVTNKLLARQASVICVAYDKMDRFFPADKIVLTGNPVRSDLLKPIDRSEALEFFGLDPQRRTLLVLGGSLGARTINNAIAEKINQLVEANVQVIWQTGKLYFEQIQQQLALRQPKGVVVVPFIARMDYAYRAAHLVISRAGAGTLSELCLVGKPAILVPSPNVAEDHQTKNAMALVDKGAAILVQDANANEQLVKRTLEVLLDADRCVLLSDRIKVLAQHNSAERIATEVEKILNRKTQLATAQIG